MSLASVLQLITTEIISNGNNEIDAITLQDVLVKMLMQPNELIGLLSNLDTVDKTDLVASINELVNDISNINVINVTQGIQNPNNNPGLTPQTADFYIQLTSGGGVVGLWIYNSQKWIFLSDEYISFAVNQGLNASQQQVGRDNLDVYSKSETNSAINSAFLGLGNIVNSVNGVNVDNSDPKNPIIATFRPLADYQNDMLLKADIDGGLTIGGIWFQDQVLSDRFANYKQVWTALSNNTIEWGNIELDKHIFLVDDINGLKIKVGGTEGTIWNELNLDPTEFELLSNKQNNLNTDGTGTKYPTVDAVNTLKPIYHHFSAQTTVTVTHNRGMYASVGVMLGTEMVLSNIDQDVSMNSVTVNFSTPQTGIIILNF